MNAKLNEVKRRLEASKRLENSIELFSEYLNEYLSTDMGAGAVEDVKQMLESQKESAKQILSDEEIFEVTKDFEESLTLFEEKETVAVGETTEELVETAASSTSSSGASTINESYT